MKTQLAKYGMLLSLALPLQGCCYFKGTCPEVLKDVIDCGVESIQARVRNLLPVVREVLMTGMDWKTALFNLGLEVGEEAVMCAVHAVVDNFKHAPPAVSPETAPLIEKAITRGEEYMSGRKIR